MNRFGRVRKDRRGGFTMLELLAVISVILILLGLVFVGLNYVAQTMRNRAAGAILGNAKSMLTEYELTVKTKPQPARVWVYGAGNTPQSAVRSLWDSPVFAPGSMSKTANLFGGVLERTGSPAVRNTGIVMSYLLRAPNNRKVLQSLPQQQAGVATEAWVSGKSYSLNNLVTYTPNATTTAVRCFRATRDTSSGAPPSALVDWEEWPSALIDNWGNPIVFVGCGRVSGAPVGGFQVAWPVDATIEYKVGYRVMAGIPPISRVFRCIKQHGPPAKALSDQAYWEDIGQVGVIGTAVSSASVIRPSDCRPFFVSAGADGDFRGADDNVYSFEQ